MDILDISKDGAAKHFIIIPCKPSTAYLGNGKPYFGLYLSLS